MLTRAPSSVSCTPRASLRGAITSKPYSFQTKAAAKSNFGASFLLPSRTLFRCFSTQAANVNGQKLNELLDGRRFEPVRQTLFSDPRERITFKEYAAMCRKYDINEEEARSYASKLHSAGLVAYFPEAEGVIYTKPRTLLDAVMKLVDPDGTFTKARAADLLKQLEEVRAELGPLQEKWNQLETRAHRYVRWCFYGLLCYLIGQGAAVARLTWWEFSWDIMEPVTYILTFSTAVIGFVYFVVTQSDYTYESLWNKWAHRRRAKLIRRTKFDEARFNELKTRESALVSQLRAIGYEVPANPVPAIECPPVASGSTTPGTEAMAKPQLA